MSYGPKHLLLLVSFSTFTATNAQCYYPGGDQIAWDQQPCVRGVITSFCCPNGWTCFSNELCVATDPGVVNSTVPLGTSIRGTCEDPYWDQTACGNFCLNEKSDGTLVPCGNNKFCCGQEAASGSCDCSTGEGTFQVDDGTALTIIGVSNLAHTSTSIFAPSSTTPSIISSIKSSSSQTTLSTQRTSSATSSTSATSSKPTSAEATGNPAKITPVTKTLGFKIGLSIGLLLLAAAAIAAYLIYKWYSEHTLENPRSPSPPRGDDGASIYDQPTFRVAPPVPHPYGGNDSNHASTSSRAPLRMVSEENNPYASAVGSTSENGRNNSRQFSSSTMGGYGYQDGSGVSGSNLETPVGEFRRSSPGAGRVGPEMRTAASMGPLYEGRTYEGV